MEIASRHPGPVGKEEVYPDAAKQTTALVGGGCVVWAARENDGPFEVVAIDHLDATCLEQLEATLLGRELERPGGWIGQAVERSVTLLLSEVELGSMAGLGLPSDERIGEVMIVPIRGAEAAIMVVRDRVAGAFDALHRRQVEGVAARAAAALNGEPPSAEGRNGEAFDPQAHHLLDSTSAALWMVDPRGTTLYVNEAASELVGRPADELVGTPIHEFLDRGPNRPRTGFYGSEAVDRPFVRADGQKLWLSVTSRPVLDGRGEYTGTLYTLEDVSERKEREVELRMRAQRHVSLFSLADTAAAGGELRELLDAAAQTISDQLEVEMSSVGRFDPERAIGEPVAISGWPEELLREDAAESSETRPLPDDSALLQAVRTGEPVLVWDYESQSVFQREPLLSRAGVRSAAVVPFAEGTAALGAHSPRPGALSSEAIVVMQAIARLLEPRWPQA